jgi:hypothetical protein
VVLGSIASDPSLHCIYKNAQAKKIVLPYSALSPPKVVLKGFADGVVKEGPDFADQLAVAIRPGAVGEQDDGDGGVEVDP